MKLIDNLEKTLNRLISFKSVSRDFKENSRQLDYIEKELAGNLFVERFTSNGYPSLIASTRKTSRPKLALAAHGDVVPASAPLFIARRVGTKIFGRGVNDMKFAIACYLTLVNDLKEKAKDYDFAIMITSDEELGGLNGVRYLLEKGFRPEVCLLPDGGQNWEIQRGAKGVLNLRIRSHGIATHGSRPWDGRNAIEQLIGFLNEIKRLFPQEPCGDNGHFHNSLNIGKIEGGQAVNQVPDFAQTDLDIRFTDEASKATLQKELKKIAGSLGRVMIEQTLSGASYTLNPNGRYAKLFANIVNEIVGKEPKYITSHGSSDARFLAEKNIPTILTRPAGGGHHSDREWIDLADLENFYAVLKEFVGRVSRVP